MKQTSAMTPSESLRFGLSQIPRSGLRRLALWIKAGNPLMYNGELLGVNDEP